MTLLLIDIFGFTIFELIVTIGAAIIAIAGFLTAFKQIRTEGWQPFWAKVKLWFGRGRAQASKIDELFELAAQMLESNQRIESELKTNGGKSLKDVVNATGAVVQKIQARIDHKDEHDPQPIFHLDCSGGICYTNSAFRDLLDAEEKDLFHRDYISRVAATDKSNMLNELNDAIANKMPLDVTVRFNLNGSGRSTLVRLFATPNVVTGSELLGYFGTATEVNGPRIAA